MRKDVKICLLLACTLTPGLISLSFLAATAQALQPPAALSTATPSSKTEDANISEPSPRMPSDFDPSVLHRGQPFPGKEYPEPRAARPAPFNRTLTAPSGIDLDVTYINRTPTYWAYCVDYPDGIPVLCPGTEGEQRWPSPGELVTFTAHVVNKGTVASPAFAYAWFIDGTPVASGSLGGLAPGAEATTTYQWSWAHTMDGERVMDDHAVRFTADPDNAISETYEDNNSLEDRTNALSFHIGITSDMVVAYNTPWNPSFSYSAEDWLQRQIAAMNWALANSSYDMNPLGATERVRINQIEVTATPPNNRGTSDGGWFVDADYRTYSGGYDPVTDVDWNLVHELSHQVGLIDLYQLNISATSVQVVDGEGFPTNFGFDWPRWDLMGGGDIAPYTDHHLYSSHSVGGISSTKGYRRGYYGEYQFDIPEHSYLRILDSQGNPADGVAVALYQRTGPSNAMGELELDNTPEITGITGADGMLLLSNRAAGGGVTTRTNHTLRDNPFGIVDVVGGGNRFLTRLGKEDHEEFVWLDITAFNLAYWQGHTDSYTLDISSHIPPAGAPLRTTVQPGRIEGDRATVCWSPSSSPAVVGYYVYRAAPPVFVYVKASDLLAGPCFSETYTGGSRIYAVSAVATDGRESAFSDFVWAPRLVNPYAVAVSSEGTRIVLDPQNGYALLRQRSDGRYIQNFGSVHFHLEYSDFLASDSLGRLLISHPGDYYSNRHSVRVADQGANPLFEFGEIGSGPGQFQTPAGVAAWGQPCTIEGPYQPDAHTLLLLHFDGSYAGASGQPGTPSATTFSSGRYKQGVLIDESDTLTYATAGNLDRSQGAIEFWVRPDWNGDDGLDYVFFEVGDGWYNRMRLAKDGANNLRFIVWNSTSEYGVAHNIAGWRSGEWHHVAATWVGTEIALFVDGQERDRRTSVGLPDSLSATLHIGSEYSHNRQANAVLDELRISGLPRVGNSDTCSYRILVADSGNHRIQAFDASGAFVTSYGALGSDPGQFNTPQGLAVDPHGQVIVADKGNNRLQVIGYDGSAFTYVRSIGVGLNEPTGVSAYCDDRILVANTGGNTIQMLSSTGDLLAEFSSPNDAYTGAFSRPSGVIGDPAKGIIVADTDNRRVVSIVGGLPAPTPPEVTIGRDSDDVVLSWTDRGALYEVHRSQSTPYFNPDIGTKIGTGTGTFTDEGILADTGAASWYVIKSICGGEVNSNRTGAFRFHLTTGTP
jgi:hypothetical protein